MSGMYRLTDKGELAAVNPHARPGMDLKVVEFMYMARQPVALEEIMDTVNLSDEKTVIVMKRLINEQNVEEI
jgi:Fe-S-cluster formation regulator IscX/YfhJ